MPNEVILNVHQLAAACKKYKGIVFMDQAGNIIENSNDIKKANSEITGVEITGVTTQPKYVTEVEITGVTTPHINIPANIPLEINDGNIPTETHDKCTHEIENVPTQTTNHDWNENGNRQRENNLDNGINSLQNGLNGQQNSLSNSREVYMSHTNLKMRWMKMRKMNRTGHLLMI